MSPIAGRFLGRDPIGHEGSECGLYEFVAGNVLESVDPTGLIRTRTGPHGGTLDVLGCETLTTEKTDIVCKYFKLGIWSLWEKELRFPYTPGVDAKKLCLAKTPANWVFERTSYEKTVTKTTWCRSCSTDTIALQRCQPTVKIGPAECILVTAVVVAKIYFDNQPDEDESRKCWCCIKAGSWDPRPGSCISVGWADPDECEGNGGVCCNPNTKVGDQPLR
jgi:hypothetical protein